ncbi:TolC family protein [Sediminitomix flava]|uniref:Outer membrane efflux protein n=1 Tax=Sediminitomix flava TaxID=379075 RepID=A0A315ZI59_SEDFL|nr:TolC family protein [Sediminitomix flava]PWJ44790.1 outer membrane efflux protein [Sediminitomix flava]
MSRIKLLIYRFIYTLLFVAIGFTSVFAQEEDIHVSIEEVFQMVVQYHPIGKQANLELEKAKWKGMKLRGFLDPKLKASLSEKAFNDKTLYQKSGAYIELPSGFEGLKFKMGLEQNDGSKLNSELTTNDGGGWSFVGIEVPLGRKEMADKRSWIQKEATLLQSLSEVQKTKKVNKLLWTVAKNYVEWHYAWNANKLLVKAYDLALFRHQSIIARINQGALAAIDSVESGIIVQQREIDKDNAAIVLHNARLRMSQHLWNEDENPIILAEKAYPQQVSLDQISPEVLEKLKSYIQTNHPFLLENEVMLSQEQLQRKILKQQFKPYFSVSYKYMYPFGEQESWYFNSLQENYNWGVKLTMPLFLRKERAALKLNTVAIDKLELKKQFLDRQLLVDLELSITNFKNYRALHRQQMKMVGNYERLRQAEIQKFNQGNSTVFYVNVREGKLIDAELKALQLSLKGMKEMVDMYGKAGMLTYFGIE